MLRKPDSIPAGDTVIEDPIMEPFFITKSKSGGYTVYERVTKAGNKNEYIRTICYPATFNYALKAVGKEMLHTKNKHFVTIKAYIKEWSAIEHKIASVTSID